MKYLPQVEAAQYWPPDTLAQWQLDRLRGLLVHASARCPFYASRFEAAGFDPGATSRLSDIQKLPLLTKSDIQLNRERMVMGITRGEPPLVPPDAAAPPEAAADPVPQALVLTAIVIGFALTSFAAVLVRRACGDLGTADVDAMRGSDS